MRITASAPGKVFLLGEYAVLEGAPALVAAVDRRVVVTVESMSGPTCALDAPDIWPERVQFTHDARGVVRWQVPQAGSRLGIVDAVLAALGRCGWLPSAPWRVRLDSSAFFDHPGGAHHKLGLGSSAAVTVALASALAAYTGQIEATRDLPVWLDELLRIHRSFQGGRGSGFDVATALYGGEIVFLPNSATPRVERVIWPPALRRLYVWSGHSASTTGFLQTLEVWRKAAPAAYAQHFAALSGAAESGRAALQRQDAGALQAAVAAMGTALRAFSRASKIPAFSADHEAICSIVEAAGGVYKPCGAGGGDLGLAVVQGDSAAARIAAALDSAGYPCVHLATDPAGLVIEPERRRAQEEIRT